MIALSKAHLTGNELTYIAEALQKQTSGDGPFTRKCQTFFREKYNFKKTLLTPSCTAALEMAAILLDIRPGDEVIVPSFTFVSTANAFVLRGANIVFSDSLPDHPNIDPEKIEARISPRTKAIVVVHYAGVAVDMDKVMALAERHGLYVVEDAAQAIGSFYKGRPLGSIGHLGCMSFHDTKNIVCGEGGLLIINDERFYSRAEIVWEKGTNRRAFVRGEVDKYGWVDIGSSFLLSEVNAAFLFAQLEKLDEIHARRMKRWECYMERFSQITEEYKVDVPRIPEFALHNAHIFYLVCSSVEQRNWLIGRLKQLGVQAFFHYPPLHHSKFYLQTHPPEKLPNSSLFFERLIRLPLYTDLTSKDQDYVISGVNEVLANLPIFELNARPR